LKRAGYPISMVKKGQKSRVQLGSLMASTPYVNSPFTVLVNKKSGINLDIDKLSKLKNYDLAGLHGTYPICC